MDEQVARDRVENIIDALKAHPNFKQPLPLEGESKTQFILRYVAHMVSPPQEEGESCEIECVDLARAIKYLDNEVEAIWIAFNKD